MIGLLFWLLLSQAYGLGLAWAVDRMAWKTRQDAGMVFAANLSCLVIILPFAGLFTLATWNGPTFLKSVFCIVLWVTALTIVQRNQYKVTTRRALASAVMQTLYFGTGFGLWLLINVASQSSKAEDVDLPFMIGTGSALLAHVLLSLFRPTLSLLWRDFSRTFRKLKGEEISREKEL